MAMRTNKADVVIEDGTPYDIAYDGSGNIDYIDYNVMGARVFRVTYTYTAGKLTGVSIPTEQ